MGDDPVPGYARTRKYYMGHIYMDPSPAARSFVCLATVQALRRKPDGRPELGLLGWMVPLAGIGITSALLFLATQGSTAAPVYVINGRLAGLESWVLTVGLYYALLVAPEIVRRKLPFEHASEQASRLVPAVLAVGAAMLTGSYLLALHFF